MEALIPKFHTMTFYDYFKDNLDASLKERGMTANYTYIKGRESVRITVYYLDYIVYQLECYYKSFDNLPYVTNLLKTIVTTTESSIHLLQGFKVNTANTNDVRNIINELQRFLDRNQGKTLTVTVNA